MSVHKPQKRLFFYRRTSPVNEKAESTEIAPFVTRPVLLFG